MTDFKINAKKTYGIVHFEVNNKNMDISKKKYDAFNRQGSLRSVARKIRNLAYNRMAEQYKETKSKRLDVWGDLFRARRVRRFKSLEQSLLPFGEASNFNSRQDDYGIEKAERGFLIKLVPNIQAIQNRHPYLYQQEFGRKGYTHTQPFEKIYQYNQKARPIRGNFKLVMISRKKAKQIESRKLKKGYYSSVQQVKMTHKPLKGRHFIKEAMIYFKTSARFDARRFVVEELKRFMK